MEIKRNRALDILAKRLEIFPVVAILGPRQCGKTTLAKQFIHHKKTDDVIFFDCEDPRDLAKLDNPMFFLEQFTGLVIIDEIQRKPDLFPVLRVLADQSINRHFLILGSASRDLIQQSSETLAGRISFMELKGFSLGEIGSDNVDILWLRGGFPLSYLAKDNIESSQWREEFIKTFLERDIPNLGIQIPASMLRRFWTMLSHYHGQIINFSDLGRSLNIADTTVRRYLDLLTGTFMLRQLHPWYYNTKKRLVKRPKIYFRDSGLLHALMSIVEQKELLNHPKLGSSWEGFALEQTIDALILKEEDVFFWAVHTGAELDLVFQKKGRLWGVEVKFTEVPRITQSIRSAIQDLELEHLWLVYPGDGTYLMDERITAVGLGNIYHAFDLFHERRNP
jgi:predicted AAA+ superfamily ATPase